MKFSKKFISLFFISLAFACTYKYEGDTTDYLFKNFNLKIKEREKIGIIGRSGSGTGPFAVGVPGAVLRR